MQKHILNQKMTYDGTQLQPLYTYLNFGVMGDSVLAFVGPCQISFQHMIDGEDLRQSAKICGDEMVHFIFEIFDRELVTGVFLQRLFASIIRDVLIQLRPEMIHKKIIRDGDDLFVDGRKLSISIASKSAVSVMVHFAVNVVNEGTPVPTACLSEFQISVEHFIDLSLEKIQNEYRSILEARQKVRPLG
jgi:hypothetical protein